MGDSENEDLDALVFPMAAEMLYEILCPREQVARLDIAIAFAGDCNFGFVVGIEAFDVDTELSLSGRSLERPARYLRMSVLENVPAQLLELDTADSMDREAVLAM